MIYISNTNINHINVQYTTNNENKLLLNKFIYTFKVQYKVHYTIKVKLSTFQAYGNIKKKSLAPKRFLILLEAEENPNLVLNHFS